MKTILNSSAILLVAMATGAMAGDSGRRASCGVGPVSAVYSLPDGEGEILLTVTFRAAPPSKVGVIDASDHLNWDSGGPVGPIDEGRSAPTS